MNNTKKISVPVCCISQNLFVNAWMPLPKQYRAKMEEKPDVSTDWKGHYMGRFEKVE